VFADLGMAPLSNAFLTEAQLDRMEPFFPLRALACSRCFLVQLGEYEAPSSIFSDYVYFSSWSSTWVAHAAAFAKRAAADLGLDGASQVVEVASNDGYLLAHFVDMGIPVLGVEPAANVAEAAVARGVPTVTEFFGADLARGLAGEHRADLLVGNNVLAHVPDLHDFVEGLAILLAPDGLVSLEFPHLLRLMAERQFDTIYHEHFSYFSLLTAADVLRSHGLVVVDVEELGTHGGSLRVWARHADRAGSPTARVEAVLTAERAAGLDTIDPYRRFAREVAKEKRDILRAIIGFKDAGLSIAGYGAPAKGNTLLNYCGIGTDLVDFTVDVSPHKQGLFLPGSHIPVRPPDALRQARPDLVFILPWNLEAEIVESLADVRDWGGRFLVRRPELTIVE
jgi:SAM-dependent methyltransferase